MTLAVLPPGGAQGDVRLSATVLIRVLVDSSVTFPRLCVCVCVYVSVCRSSEVAFTQAGRQAARWLALLLGSLPLLLLLQRSER